nr:hypothetical protein [Allorhodopirellula heiligendammensis]
MHMLVPGAGPSRSKSSWKEAKAPPKSRSSDG